MRRPTHEEGDRIGEALKPCREGGTPRRQTVHRTNQQSTTKTPLHHAGAAQAQHGHVEATRARPPHRCSMVPGRHVASDPPSDPIEDQGVCEVHTMGPDSQASGRRRHSHDPDPTLRPLLGWSLNPKNGRPPGLPLRSFDGPMLGKWHGFSDGPKDGVATQGSGGTRCPRKRRPDPPATGARRHPPRCKQ